MDSRKKTVQWNAWKNSEMRKRAIDAMNNSKTEIDEKSPAAFFRQNVAVLYARRKTVQWKEFKIVPSERILKITSGTIYPRNKIKSLISNIYTSIKSLINRYFTRRRAINLIKGK